ncbi:cupin domain-containing protein [Spirochaetota bacterium]
MKQAEFWIKNLALKKHPEGGYFRETYRAKETINGDCLPQRFNGSLPFSTSIYYLLHGDEHSALHRIKSDELWHFYTGSALTLHVIDEKGIYSNIRLGNCFDKGQLFQAVVYANSWFGVTVNDRESYSLVGCTVAPGFDFGDFEIGKKDELLVKYPEQSSIIERLAK